MSAGFTFGSLGDILQLCQIGIAASKALSDTSGSVSDYKDLRHDIDRFVQILQNVIATYQEREHPERLSGIKFLIQSVCQDCASDLQEALDYFHTKYGPSFSGQRHRLNPKTIARKMGYAFKEKERLQQLRRKLSWTTQSLSLLLTIYNRNAARVNNSTLEGRYQEVLSKLQDMSKDIELQTVRLSEQHAGIKGLIITSATTSDHLESKATQDQKLAQEISNNTSSIQELSAMAETTMKVLVERRENDTSVRSYSGPGRTSKAPLLFEDSFGSVLEIPMEWVFCWEHLKILINNRFEHQLGHQNVLRGEYVLEDDISGQEVTSLPWAQVMRPGKKINMAMKFCRLNAAGSKSTEDYICPGCRTVMARKLDSNGNLMCVTAGCGMLMRRSLARKSTWNELRRPSGSNGDHPCHYHRVRFDIYFVKGAIPTKEMVARSGKKAYITRQIWYCCNCADGPYSYRIENYCHSCKEHICHDCTRITIGRWAGRNDII